MPRVRLNTKVIDNEVYISLNSLSKALKARAEEYTNAANNSTDRNTKITYLTVAQELDYRATMLDFADIAYHEQDQDET